MTYEDCLQNFRDGFSLTQNVNYNNRKSVANNNRGVTAYRNAAEHIGKLYPERVKDFAGMLGDEDPALRRVCAVCILELMDAAPEIRGQALDVIRDACANGDPLDRTAWGMWLKTHGFV